MLDTLAPDLLWSVAEYLYGRDLYALMALNTGMRGRMKAWIEERAWRLRSMPSGHERSLAIGVGPRKTRCDEHQYGCYQVHNLPRWRIALPSLLDPSGLTFLRNDEKRIWLFDWIHRTIPFAVVATTEPVFYSDWGLFYDPLVQRLEISATGAANMD